MAHHTGWGGSPYEPAGHRVNRALPGSGPTRAGRWGQALESANAGQGGGVRRGGKPYRAVSGTATKTPAHRRGFPVSDKKVIPPSTMNLDDSLIMEGDALYALRLLPSNSIQCVVTCF